MLGLRRIFAALTISCSVTNSLSRPLAMIPPRFWTGVGFCASTGPRQMRRFTSTRGPFRNAAIGARLDPTKKGKKHGKPVCRGGGGGAQERRGGNPRKAHQRLHRRRDRRRRPPPAAKPGPVQDG